MSKKQFTTDDFNAPTTSACDNCDWEGDPTVKFPNIPNLLDRIDPGGVVPSGECPECGALCYPLVEDDYQGH